MGSKRNRGSRRGESPSLEGQMNGSVAEASPGNEIMIETSVIFDNVSSV